MLPSLKIVSWNIRWGGKDRLASILAALQQHMPGVVVLSEVTGDESGGALVAGLERMGLFTCTPLPPPGRHLGVLIAAREPCRTVTPIATADLKSWHVIAAEFAELTVFGIYLPWDDRKAPYWALLHDELQRRQGRTVLVTGDFNTGLSDLDGSGEALKHAAAMAKMEMLGLYDPWRAAHPEVREFTWGQGSAGTQRLDYAYVSQHVLPRHINVHHSHAERLSGTSDHSMLIVTIDSAALEPAPRASEIEPVEEVV